MEQKKKKHGGISSELWSLIDMAYFIAKFGLGLCPYDLNPGCLVSVQNSQSWHLAVTPVQAWVNFWPLQVPLLADNIPPACFFAC